MELFFMMTAMLALLGPIAAGRVRCMRIAPRLLDLVNCILATVSHPEKRLRSNTDSSMTVAAQASRVSVTNRLRPCPAFPLPLALCINSQSGGNCLKSGIS